MFRNDCLLYVQDWLFVLCSGRQYENTMTTMQHQISNLQNQVRKLEINNMQKQTTIDEFQDKLDALQVTYVQPVSDQQEGTQSDWQSEADGGSIHVQDSTVFDNSTVVEPARISQKTGMLSLTVYLNVHVFL